MGFPRGSVVKNPLGNAGDTGLIPGSEISPGEVFLPGKSHGQRSLAGYSPKDPERVRLDFQTKQCNAKRVLKTSLHKGELCIHLALFIEYLAYWHELGP